MGREKITDKGFFHSKISGTDYVTNMTTFEVSEIRGVDFISVDDLTREKVYAHLLKVMKMKLKKKKGGE